MARRGRATLQAYLTSIAVVFLAVSLVGVMYERAASVGEAGSAARDDASFAANLAARDIDRGLETTRAAVAQLAANPQTAQFFDSPGGCAVRFFPTGSFAAGHYDVVTTDGAVVCSSMPETRPAGYEGAAWLPAARAGPAISGPAPDPRSGTQVVIVTAPIPGFGFAAAFLGLDALGPGLSSEFAGPRRLEFLVAAADGGRAVTRSIDPQRWAGRDLAATPFAAPGAGGPRRDVDGTSRFYSSAPVNTTGWSVYAGADRAQVLATIDAHARRELVLALAVLLIMVATALVVAKRIARPISMLSDEVRLAATNTRRPPVRVSGPREVARLAEDFNQLTAELRRELDSTARLAAIVESSRESIISWTTGGVITTWNPECERMYGFPAQEAIGQDLSLIVPPGKIAEIGMIHEEIVQGKPVQTLDTERVRRDGTIIDVAVTVSPIHDRTGAFVGLSSVGRDITVAKRAVEALRSSEARKGAVLASALDAIITMNGAGTIEEFNPAAERMFGYACATVLGRDLGEVLLPPGQRDVSDHGLDRYLSRGDDSLLGRRSELTAMRADGSLFPAEASVTLVDGRGSPVYTWFIRDRTADDAAEAQRQSLEQRLHQSQRLESLGQLAGGVAHDFNNLLAVIINYATFVASAVPDDEGVRFDVEQILSASERAVALTRQLLMFGRREPVQLETLDMNQVVEEFRSLLSRSAGDQVALVLVPAAEVAAIRADRGQVEQVLINLAVNARDAMPDGGILRFETSVIDLAGEGAVHHPGNRPGRYVRLSVVDSGVGMSPEVLARAFDPFFTTKGKTEGSGLGLATVYGIVSELGGDVTLTSEEGVGTTISMCFPVTTVAAAPRKAPSPTPIRGNGETVLVVDDQAAVRELTVRILRRNGYVVLDAESAAAAIEIAHDHAIDLLVTDVEMPKMDGPQLTEALHRRHPAVPVLYMSGYAQGVLGPRRALEGAALIHKPFNEAAILHLVHETIASGTRGAPTPVAP
jgi:PAS domain S-box-containing protein